MVGLFSVYTISSIFLALAYTTYVHDYVQRVREAAAALNHRLQHIAQYTWPRAKVL